MRSLGTRRAVLVAGAAAMAAVALAGCSAGQVAETALKRPSNMGVNKNNSNNTVAVRNLAVVYNDPAGYPSGATAPLQLALYNQTTQEVTVMVSSSRPTAGNDPTVVTGTSVTLSGSAPTESAAPIPAPVSSASDAPPSGAPTSGAPTSEAPSVAPAQPAQIKLAPMGYTTFLPGGPQSLQIIGLTGKLIPGRSVYVTFTFSNGADPLTVPAPTGIPGSPASRAPGIENENVEE